MKQLTIIQTFLSRFLILVLNFGLVIFSTNIWGSEGKGIISILVADLAIIGFFANIFVGSSVTYFSSKYKTEQILLYAYSWSVIVGFAIPVIFSFTQHSAQNLNYLIVLSVIFSLLNSNINLFVGKQNINKFNVYTILQQALHLFFIVVLLYFFKKTEVSTYFVAQIFCYLVLFIFSSFELLKNINISNISFSKNIVKSLFNYGWKTQLSAFVQFLNYRLSYYFLEYFKGIASVGVFSVGVAFSEAIWMVSRSLSVILYSDVVNSKNHQDSIEKTKISLRISFLITLVSLIAILIIPAQVYVFIFGKEFNHTKQIILLLSPGILAIAVSNIIGHYFAGVNQLLILNIKSIIGLVFTIISSFYFIPKWGILGACIVTTISYFLSSSILFWKFYQITTFRVSDFILSKSEINLLLQKFSVKNNS